MIIAFILLMTILTVIKEFVIKETTIRNKIIISPRGNISIREQ